MRPLAPTPITIDRTTSTSARERDGSTDTLHALGRLIPRPRWRPSRVVGSRLLVFGLAVWLAIGPLMSRSAVAQQAVQIPTPTPTPTTTPLPQIQISPTDLGTGTITVDPTTSPVQQAPITVSGCGGPDYIFQGCSIAPIGATEPERRLEAQAITMVLQQYQLPESDRALVLRYLRDDVRSALFAQVTAAFRKEPGNRSDDEKLLVGSLTRLVREKRVEAAMEAQRQYRRWADNPCGYTPPPGFSYSTASACVGMSQLFRPESPGTKAFLAYGAAAAFKTLKDDPNAQRVSGNTASAALLGYGYAAALGAAGAGALIGSTFTLGALSGVLPWLPAVVAHIAATGSAAGLSSLTVAEATALAEAGASTVSGGSGALAIGGPILIIIGALVTGVVAGISVFTEAAIPGQLQEWLDASRSYDVDEIIRTNADLPENVAVFDFTGADLRRAPQQQVYATFIIATLPDHPTQTAPTAQPGDRRFVVAGSPVDWLQYQGDDGSWRSARLHGGGFFADRRAIEPDEDARLTLSIKYRDADGAVWTAGRLGNQFVIVRVGDPSAADYPPPRLSPDLPVLGWGSNPFTASVGE